MKKNNVLFIFCVILLVPHLAMSATNPRWITKISLNTPFPIEGALLTFSAHFKVKQGPVDNLKVVALLDGTKIFQTIYPHLNINEEKIFSVNRTATLGNHRLVFIIDPQNTSGDVNQGDNLRGKNFTVNPKQVVVTTAVLEPDLEITLYSVNKAPAVGDTIDLSAKIKNIGKADSKPCDLRFKLGNITLPPSYPVPRIKPTRHFEVTIPKKLDRLGTYYFKAELLNSTDINKTNNSASLVITPGAPDLVITKCWQPDEDFFKRLWGKVMVRVWVKNTGNADSGAFEIDAFFQPCKGIAQGRKWAHVDNLKPHEEVMREITHRFGCIGKKWLEKVVVDKDNKVFESNEDNNEVKYPFWYNIGE
jgi:subtilase family serine protease